MREALYVVLTVPVFSAEGLVGGKSIHHDLVVGVENRKIQTVLKGHGQKACGNAVSLRKTEGYVAYSERCMKTQLSCYSSYCLKRVSGLVLLGRDGKSQRIDYQILFADSGFGCFLQDFPGMLHALFYGGGQGLVHCKTYDGSTVLPGNGKNGFKLCILCIDRVHDGLAAEVPQSCLNRPGIR